MAVTFFDCDGLVFVEYVRHPMTVNQRTFQAILQRFHQAWLIKRPWSVVQGCQFLHMDNASSHTATDTLTLLAQLGITQVPHPAYSPDLAPNDFWFYPRMKEHLRGCCFANYRDLLAAVHEQIDNIRQEEFRDCILVKWPERWRRCLERRGEYF